MGQVVMSPLDWLLFRRTLAAHLVALAIALGVVAATDEVTSTVAMRLARLCAFSPFIGALCVLGVSLHARSRGELRAVESLGASPSRACRGAALAALALAVLALLTLASPLADPLSLLPVVHTGVDWTFDEGGHAARALGVVFGADGGITLPAAPAGVRSGVRAGWIAIPCLAPVALLTAPWAVAPMPRALRIGTLALTGMSVIALLHLVAGERLTPAAGAVACCPLALALSWSRLRQRAGASSH